MPFDGTQRLRQPWRQRKSATLRRPRSGRKHPRLSTRRRIENQRSTPTLAELAKNLELSTSSRRSAVLNRSLLMSRNRKAPMRPRLERPAPRMRRGVADDGTGPRKMLAFSQSGGRCFREGLTQKEMQQHGRLQRPGEVSRGRGAEPDGSRGGEMPREQQMRRPQTPRPPIAAASDRCMTMRTST